MSLTRPQVCICIPTYNSALTIQRTLTSLLNQTYENHIIHISDNASTDSTLEIIEAFKSEKIVIHRHHENIGGEGNFNRCIAYAEGTYTSIFHADDLYHPTMVEEMVHFLENHQDHGAVLCAANLIDENDSLMGKLSLPDAQSQPYLSFAFGALFRAVLKHSNFLVCPSAMVKTDIYKHHIQKWDGSRFKTSADLDVWLRISQVEKLAVLSKPLMSYRISTGQYSERLRKRTFRSDMFLVLEYYLAQSDVQASLGPQDHRNYARLMRTDRVLRAFNHFSNQEDAQARELIRDQMSADAFLAALHSKRALMTLIGLVALQLLFFTRCPDIFRPLLTKVRKIAKK